LAFVAKPTVLVADDHQILLDRVLALLRPKFDVVGTANNGSDLVMQAQRLRPDMIVLDVTMPVVSGVEAAHELHRLGSRAKLVFLTVHKESAFLQACIAEGALGYVTKSRLATDLIPALEKAISGHFFISPDVRR
jgi:DNA-binding NarL/FixJ family response regulator